MFIVIILRPELRSGVGYTMSLPDGPVGLSQPVQEKHNKTCAAEVKISHMT